ncbi:LuxR family transcriptional regulator [Streptomyces inusitatus]|uniref:LuxR family transcriptional regulator n=2 Tax=Streptomyces inusitatus TaxID=68221 RepID=A0A918QKB6_9ACTN|nr:LuxR family transcriptional regulator [Streptomyces inusitatus]
MALSRALSAAHTGHPSTVLVEGPAGSGKTTLVDHVLIDRAHPLRVLRATGVPWESGIALGVAGRLLRTTPPDGPGDPRDPGDPGDPGDPRESDGRTILGTARRLHRLWTAPPHGEPLVVVVDDAHWADVESLRAIESAVRALTTERLLVILLARDDTTGPGPRRNPPVETLEHLDGRQGETIRLGPLDPEDVRELARHRDGVDLSLPAARHLCRHTRGNPRHITRLLQELPRDIWQDWRPALPAPSRYTSVVRHSLASCGEAARALVEACSVIDGDAPLDEAARLAGLPDPLPAADEAAEAGLLIATVEPGRALLAFPHPLTRAAVLTTLGLTRRRLLHLRAAEVADDPGRRLAHRAAATTTDAGLADELDRYAAERAGAGEWATVAATLVRAGRLSPVRAVREDRLLRAVDAMIGAGDIPQAVAFAAELESFPTAAPRDVVLGYLAIMRGRSAEAETFLTRAWARCDAATRPDLTAKICQRRVLHALGRWDAPGLVTWARRALELADPADPAAIESEAVLGLGLAAMGRAEEAVSVYESAAAKVSGGAQSQRFQLGRGWVDLALDAPEAARRAFEEAVPTGYRLGSTRISLWAQGWLARTQFALGAWPEALETVERAAARLTEVRIELVRPLVHWTGAQLHALRGDWESAEDHLARAAAGGHHYEVMMVPAALARAQVAEARGDYARAVDALAPVVRLPSRAGVDEPGFWPWPDVYANALVMTHRVEEADAFLTPHEELAARRGHRSTRARLGLVRGRITAARGDIDAARHTFETALARLDRLPLPYDLARVNFAYGQTLRRAGKRRDADTVLRNARDAYSALGAHTYVERCDRELNAGGLNGGRAAAGADRLTAQERAVAGLVAAGASNQRTASELFISVKTVQYHLTRIYAKLGIRSRGELAASFHGTVPGTATGAGAGAER